MGPCCLLRYSQERGARCAPAAIGSIVRLATSEYSIIGFHFLKNGLASFAGCVAMYSAYGSVSHLNSTHQSLSGLCPSERFSKRDSSGNAGVGLGRYAEPVATHVLLFVTLHFVRASPVALPSLGRLRWLRRVPRRHWFSSCPTILNV